MNLARLGCLVLCLLAMHCSTAAGLSQQQSHSLTVSEILRTLSKNHYRKLTVDDTFSARLLNAYIESLDPTKAYFLASDLEAFSLYRKALDEALLRGELEPAFDIYGRFRERVKSRLESNIDFLESDFVFNFNRDEEQLLDPESYSWLASSAEMDEFWRKRMKDALLRLELSGKERQAARELLVKRYSNQLKQLNQQGSDDVFQLFINAVAGIYDPHTIYLSPRTLENFNISMSLSLEGIGAVLQLEDEHTKIVRIVPGGPADKEGSLKTGDKIIGVAQGQSEPVDVIGWRLDDVVELIRGKKGSVVRLEVIPASADGGDVIEVVTIERDKVKLEEQSAQSEVIEIPQGDGVFRAGIITIPAFYMDFEAYRKRDPNFKSTSRDVKALIDDLLEQDVDGLLLDLRNNGGGSLYEATALTELFIDPGPVVQIRHANNRISRDQRARRRAHYEGPLLVLINRLSASASEIFAGAIQDYGRGLVVGSNSFGKGSVQVLAPLKHGRLKFTESKFYRVSGQSTQHRGVAPDIAFPSYYNEEDIGESSRDNALPWDSIRPQDHRMYFDLAPHLDKLRQRHSSRTASNPDWGYMLDEIAIMNKQRAQTSLPLSLIERQRLKSEREQQWLEIENRRRQRRQLPPLADYKALNESREEAREDKQLPDPQLDEAGVLLVDYSALISEAASRLVQRTQ